MSTKHSALSRRSYEPLTDAHLRRLATLAELFHERFQRAQPEWAATRLAACLVQGAARHRLYGDRGVKDLDVYTFYATTSGRNAGQFPWNRQTEIADFGSSDLGRQLYTEEDLEHPKIAREINRLRAFEGRRVDLMGRAIAPHPSGSRAAVEAWLRGWSAKRRPHPEAKMPSAWHLSRVPVICLWPEIGPVWWPGPADDVAGLEKGAYEG